MTTALEYKINAMNAIIMTPSEKLRSPMTCRFTTGRFAVSSQPIAPVMPRNASTNITRMNGEFSQSSSSPRSSATCRQPSPRVISDIPM